MAAGFFMAGGGGIYAAEFLFPQETTMGLINPKPRFGYETESDRVYDYVVQRDVALTDRYEARDGVWNLHEVKRLILAGEPVEGARIPSAAPVTSPPPPFIPTNSDLVPAPSTSLPQDLQSAIPTKGHVTGLSVAQLLELKLSALQAAALGITPTQMSATGLTATQVQAWALTPERAEALKLTAEQRAVLLP